MSEPSSFLFVGNGPYANRGCEAIAKTSIRLVREHFPGAPIINGNEHGDHDQVDEREPDVTHMMCQCLPGPFSRMGVSDRIYGRTRLMVDLSRASQFVREWAPKSRAVLSMGGDLYGLSMGRACLLQYLFFGEAALRCRKPFVIWCATIGRMESVPHLKKRVIEHFRRCTLILVREEASLAYLAENGVRDNVRLVADPAFLLEPAAPELPLPIKEPLEETIGFNLAGAYAMTGALGSYRDTIKLGADCVERIIRETGRPVVLVPHVVFHPTAGGDNDTISHALLREALQARGLDVPVLPSWMRCWELKWALGQMKAYIGSRFHSTVAAFGSGTPTVSLTYSEKGPALNSFVLGNEQFALPYGQLTPDRLMEKLNAILADEKTIRKTLAARIPQIRELSRLAGTHLGEALAA